MAPLLPSYLAEPPRGIPAERTTTAPPSLLKQVVANRIRLADTAKPPSKLAGVDVEFAQGGYLVTRKYEDYSRVLSDGRPAYLWEVTTFVSESEVRVKQPDGTPPEPPRPPSPPFHTPQDGTPPATHPPKDFTINPKDPFGLLDPNMDQLRKEAHLRKVVNDHLMEQHQREQRARKEEVLSDESIAAMEEIIAAAGWASLDTALTVGTVVPVAGTVIAGGTAFHQQYNKTRDTLLKNGINPAEAHRRALLQALVVGGVAVGADIATGSVLGKLKTVAKFKAFDKSKIDFIEDAARKGRLSGENVELAKKGADAVVDNVIVATGQTTVGTGTTIANSLIGGGFGRSTGNRPAIAQPPRSGGNSYGVHFRLP